MSLRSKSWILLSAAVVLAGALASLLLEAGFTLLIISDIAQCALLLGAVVSFLPSVSSTRGRVRLFWTLMSLGLVLWSSYQLLWTYFEVALRRDVPNPFVGDIVLFLHIVPMMAALALVPHAEQDEHTSRLGSLDFALLLVWWLYLYLYAVIPWQYVHTDATIYEHSLNVLYLTEKVAFLAALAVVWFRSEKGWKVVYGHLFAAMMIYALSSYVANWGIERNTYYSGSLYDIPLAVSMAWFVVVGIVARELSPKQRTIRSTSTHGVWVARLGMVAIFSLPLFAAWSLFDGSIPHSVSTFRVVLTLGAMLVMGAMVFFKQHVLDRELLRLLRGSQDSYENLRRLQSQLVQSEKLASLGQLVGGAAHELNNPLTAMMGYSDLLSATPLEEEEKAVVEKIGQQVRRTRSLVSSLLSFAKQAPLEKSPLDLNALAHTAVNLCQEQLNACNIRVQTDFAHDVRQVIGDSNQLLQVCLHIINSALQSMSPKGGVLRATTRQEQNMAVIEFAEDANNASGPSTTTEFSSAGRPPGASTGLSACYGIVQEHHGKILFQNRSEGGTVFRIELPCAATPATRAKLASAT
ncbi:MAG TPA: histidine kinase dimerization/phospho-acceptor domain-containing protein [Terriglobales bacterium]|nr:histidine kinase dimerization/phospho-acceptor domain-containing protein [Terriglobales bacterium]